MGAFSPGTESTRGLSPVFILHMEVTALESQGGAEEATAYPTNLFEAYARIPAGVVWEDIYS